MIKYLILSLSLLLLGCNKQQIEPIAQEQKIVALGDSLTFGYGGRGTNYPEELGKIIKRQVVNEGVSGDTTQSILERVDNVLESQRPSYVLLAIGGNDMLRRVSDDVIIKNINTIIDKIQEKGIVVILVSEPRPKAIGMLLGISDAAFYKEIAKEQKIELIDNVFSSLLNEETLKSDLIHLNDKGYIKAAEKIAEQLKDKKFIN